MSNNRSTAPGYTLEEAGVEDYPYCGYLARMVTTPTQH